MSAIKIVCYIPMLEGQADEVQRWLDGVRDRYGVIPVMLPPVNWNDDLTPWPAGPIFKKGKSFGGKADAYLHKLEKEIIPGIEADSRNAHLKGIAQDTGSVVKILESKGIQTTFEWTEGTHFGPILPRLDKALMALKSIQ